MKKNDLLATCFFVTLALTLFFQINAVSAQDVSSLPAPSVSPRIIGGYEATPGEWPWMTALVERGEEAYLGQFCGGSLIDAQWVVTAAHCVENKRAGQIDVVINRHNLTSEDGERIAVTRILKHRNYDPETLDSDIALLLLASPSSQQAVAILPPRDPEQLALPFTEATILGWGDTTPGNCDYPEVLMEVKVPIVPGLIARRIYGDSYTMNMLAAGPRDGEEDACYGDSGGPLVVRNAEGNGYVLAGITSWGRSCAQPQSPGLYTRVTRFAYWIDLILNLPPPTSTD